MLYKAIWIWLAIQIPLGMFFGLMIRAGGRTDWAEQNAESDLSATAAPVGVAVEQGAQ